MWWCAHAHWHDLWPLMADLWYSTLGPCGRPMDAVAAWLSLDLWQRKYSLVAVFPLLQQSCGSSPSAAMYSPVLPLQWCKDYEARLKYSRLDLCGESTVLWRVPGSSSSYNDYEAWLNVLANVLLHSDSQETCSKLECYLQACGLLNFWTRSSLLFFFNN